MRTNIILGFFNGKPIYSHNETNYLTFGPPGSGKSAQLQTALLGWPGSAIVCDWDAEHARVTADYRAKLGKVIIANPDNLFPEYFSRFKCGGYNAVGPHRINPRDMKLLGINAENTGRSLIFQKASGSDNARYFYEGSTRFATMLIKANALVGSREEQNLRQIVRIMNGGAFQYISAILPKITDPDLREDLKSFLAAKNVKSVGEVVENAKVELNFLMNPAVAASVSRNDLTFQQCKREITTIYLTASTKNLKVMRRLMRLWFGSAMSELREDGGIPTMLFMDEAGQAGHIEEVPESFAGLRKMGVHLWLATQDIGQLKAAYPDDWQSLINCSGVVQMLGCNDVFSAEYFSKKCGQTQVIVPSKNVGLNSTDNRWTFGDGLSIKGKPLIEPHEVMGLRDWQILFFQGISEPILCNPAPYFRIAELKKRSGSNPYFRG